MYQFKIDKKKLEGLTDYYKLVIVHSRKCTWNSTTSFDLANTIVATSALFRSARSCVKIETSQIDMTCVEPFFFEMGD